MPFGALPTRGVGPPDLGEVISGPSRRSGVGPPRSREDVSGPLTTGSA